MNYPVYVLEYDDEIPLPGQVYHLLVPEARAKYLDSVEFVLGRDEIKKRVLLAFSKTQSDCSIMCSPKQYEEETYSIGVLATLMEPEDTAEGLSFFTLKIEGRALVCSEISIDKEKERVYVNTQFYQEELSDEEQSIYSDIDALSKVISKNPHIFKGDIGERLTEERSLFRRMDLMADFVFTAREERLQYLQEECNLDRWIAITSKISTLVSNIRKNPEKAAFKVTEKQRSTDYKNLSFKERLEITPFPESIREKVAEEVSRLENMPGNSTEASMLKDYVSWVFKVPWNKSSNKDFSLKNLRGELDTTHYGLADVKDYLIEHMCLEKLKGSPSGAILCFSGPPGTGKSSIAKTLARASGREFQSIALGGVSDESEIRGHRRTYLASRPGRIIAGLCNANTMNPVVLLDEVDKIDGSRGSPSAALLEVLDPEQNKAFIDRYLELEIDLSNILFICTANYEEQIPPPLRDRMEFIRFREYTEEERLVILNKYILPKSIADYCVGSLDIEWTDEILEELSKTKQVRQIEQRVRRLLRVAATNIVAYEQSKQIINKEYAKALFKNREEVIKTSIGFSRE